jgi:hypothetical protein
VTNRHPTRSAGEFLAELEGTFAEAKRKKIIDVLKACETQLRWEVADEFLYVRPITETDRVLGQLARDRADGLAAMRKFLEQQAAEVREVKPSIDGAAV